MARAAYTDGNVLYDDDLNDNFASLEYAAIYTSTGFDTTAVSTTNTASYEFSAITAADLANADYLIIEITALTAATNNGGSAAGASCNFHIETKEVGGSYADSFPDTLVHEITTTSASSGDTIRSSVLKTFKWVHTLTAGEKSNGVQVKVSSTSTAGTSCSAAVTNKQTTIKLGY